MLRILIIEDNAGRQAVFRRLYAQHRVTICQDGLSAIRALRNSECDLIHLDFDLEGQCTGADIAETIREFGVRTPVIVHSENPHGVEMISKILPQSLPIPFSKFVTKNEMTSRLKALLSQSESLWTEQVVALFQANSMSPNAE